ncbi:MAG: hypothetical protein ACTSPH_07930 [Promethearchaeota archaeon]
MIYTLGYIFRFFGVVRFRKYKGKKMYKVTFDYRNRDCAYFEEALINALELFNLFYVKKYGKTISLYFSPKKSIKE